MTFTIPSQEQVDALDGPGLVALHNQAIEALGRGNKTQRFADRKSGIKRIQRVFEELRAAGAKEARKADMGDDGADRTPTPHPPAKKPPAKKAAPSGQRKTQVKRGYRFVFKPKSEIKPPKKDSKRDQTLQLLMRKGGASHSEVRDTVWSDVPDPNRTAYEAMRLLHYQHGYGLKHLTDGDDPCVQAYTEDKKH